MHLHELFNFYLFIDLFNDALPTACMYSVK